MKSSLQTFTSFCHRSAYRRLWLFTKHVRYMSRGAEVYAEAIHKQERAKKITQKAAGKPTPLTFQDLGLHPPIVESLGVAFPNVKYPTKAQASFIPAILENKDVLLQDTTGSGKSFGLILSLLNKPRLKARTVCRDKIEEKRHITSLMIVPHRDLAYQLLHWIERLVNAARTYPPPSVSSIVQVLVRDEGAHLTTGLAKLQQDVPHILIGTSQALLDIYQKDPFALQLPHLSSVVVDEVDYLIETVPRKDPNKSFRGAYEKAARKLKAHPGETRQLLDIIYAGRKEVNKLRRDESGLAHYQRSSGEAHRSLLYPASPQLILSSATLRVSLKNYLFEESGWLDRDHLLKVNALKAPHLTRPPASVRRENSLEAEGEDSPQSSLGGSGISHSVVVVSDYGFKNIADAAKSKLPALDTEIGQELSPESIFNTPVPTDNISVDPKLAEKYANSASPFNPNTIEAIATAFALDVPSIALLVLPASAPVQRAVYELRAIGVNAHGLDLLAADKGRSHLLNGGGTVQENPTLLVSTLASTRGLDLPELTHVFILGIPEGPKVTGRTVDAYLHLAGRVGRFGRGGRVITVVEEKEEEDSEDMEARELLEKKTATSEFSGRRGVITDASRMARILREIQVTPVQFEHFD